MTEKQKNKYFRYFGYNTYRLITSGMFFAFVIVCLIFNQNFVFSLPKYAYIIFTVYFAIFPIKDMISSLNKTNYKSKQFEKCFRPVANLDEEEFLKTKKRYDKGALYSILFWLSFMAVVGVLYLTGTIPKIWIVFFFAMSDFCVYFAIFFWCPFHKIFVKPHCCMDCRIFNWDSFFSFSFLIFIPSVYTYILIALSLMSLVQWEITYKKHPKRFFRISNESLSCEYCDIEHCKNRKELLKTTK